MILLAYGEGGRFKKKVPILLDSEEKKNYLPGVSYYRARIISLRNQIRTLFLDENFPEKEGLRPFFRRLEEIYRRLPAMDKEVSESALYDKKEDQKEDQNQKEKEDGIS